MALNNPSSAVLWPHGLKQYKKIQLSFNSNTFPLRLLVPIPTTGFLIFNFIVHILWALALEILGGRLSPLKDG